MLLLVFLMLLLGLFALFLGGGLVGQGYLYQQPADKLPVRALVAAALVGGFITFWVWIDKRAPEKYDTLFNFKGESTAEFNEFEAVRWTAAGGKLKLDTGGKPTETIAKFKRPAGSKGAFAEEGTGAAFELRGYIGGTQYMVGAIRVKGPDDPEPVRYNANLKEDKTYPPEVRFEAEKGSRYVKANQFGTLYVPSTGTVIVALLLNFLLLVVWVVAFWPVLRFSLGHALMFTAILAVVTMLALMPVLFKPNRAPKPPASPGNTPTALVRFTEVHPS
jgi:hypothetical protein